MILMKSTTARRGANLESIIALSLVAGIADDRKHTLTHHAIRGGPAATQNAAASYIS